MIQRTYVEGPPVSVEYPSTTSGAIKFVSDAPEHVTLSATTAVPALLVLTDQFYPGWTATIDGVATELRRVNFFARGVVIPKGTHTVDFVYSPTSLWSGVFCTAIALALFLLALGSVVIKVRKKVAETSV